MPNIAIDSAEWRERLAAYLPAQLRTLIQGASGRDLIKKIDTTFLLHDDTIVHLESKKFCQLTSIDASTVAAGCAQLLDSLSAEQRKECAALLLLPANYFVATRTAMPGVAKDNLVAALKIQADSILPSFDSSLALAINAQSAVEGDEHLALWIAEATISEFFTAFEEQEIFLAAIKPRFLNGDPENTSNLRTRILDTDSQTQTYAEVEGNVLKSLLHVRKQDLEQEIFQRQWQESLLEDVDAVTVELNEVSDYYSRTDVEANQDYCFFPYGALNATRRTAQGKQYIAAAAAVVVMLFVAAIPFIAQSLEFRSLAATLQIQRDLASGARQDQAAVVSFENEWGLISDFPEQRIGEAMFTLQNILRPDTLTSLEVSDGLIKIQGNSNEPQAILQRLEQDPMFTEVVFSRATNNTRYYIDLRLSTVNFEGYMIRYFPDA